MALPLTSKLGFFRCDGKPLDVPLEWQPALIEVKVPIECRRDVKLWVQNQAIELYLKSHRGQERILADWERANPGHYQLRLEYQGEIEEHIITILPQKISPQAFAQLLEDLEKLPVTIAIALQRLGAFIGIDFIPPEYNTLPEELHRLKRAVDGTDTQMGLRKILIELARDPHKILQSETIWVQQAQVRRPAISGLIQSFRGHNLDQDNQPIRVLDQRVEHTFDVYENQLVNQFTHQVTLRLKRLEQLLKAIDQTSRSFSPLHLETVQNLIKSLQHARRQASFLDEVGLLKRSPDHLTMVLLNRPVYRAAFAEYLEFSRRATVRIEDPAITAPLKNLPHLYEVWGTLRVIDICLEVAQAQGYSITQQQLIDKDKSGFFIRVLPDGKSAIELHHPKHRTKIRLIPQRRYSQSGKLRSVSFCYCPDIAVEVEPPDGALPRIYLFDPKYKLDSELSQQSALTPDVPNNLGEPKQQDIDKMHTYRDAIRDKQGQRVVEYAAILYPGRYISYGRDLAALPADPDRLNELQAHLCEVMTQALQAPC